MGGSQLGSQLASKIIQLNPKLINNIVKHTEHLGGFEHSESGLCLGSAILRSGASQGGESD